MQLCVNPDDWGEALTIDIEKLLKDTRFSLESITQNTF